MFGKKNSGGNMNLSGGLGSPYEMEPWAYEALGRNRGLKQGRHEGYEEGHSEGHSKGFDNGFWAGRSQAWNTSIAVISEIRNQANNIRNEANNYCICMNAFRRAFDTLLRENIMARNEILRVIYANYIDEVQPNLDHGIISVPPHLDQNFIEEQQLTRQLINDAFDAEASYLNKK